MFLNYVPASMLPVFRFSPYNTGMRIIGAIFFDPAVATMSVVWHILALTYSRISLVLRRLISNFYTS